MITKSSEHQADGGEVQERQRLAIEVFEVLGQPSAATEPSEGSFDDPSAGQNFEAFGGVRALDDLGVDERQGLLLRVVKLRALVAAVCEQLLQKWELPEQRAQDESAAITILNVGRMNERMKQQAYRIDKNMPLLALDLLSGIVAVRIDAAPPFSALFTLWLSMTAAVGLASRPAASRHFT